MCYVSPWLKNSLERKEAFGTFHIPNLTRSYGAFRNWCTVWKCWTHKRWLEIFFWENLLGFSLLPGLPMTRVSHWIFFSVLADLISYWPVISRLPCFTSFLASTPQCSWTYYRAISPRRWRVHPKGAITVNKHYCRLSDNMLPRW